MHTMPYHKYTPYKPVDLPDRRWPSRTITQAPAWCSVDLRDGNQALAIPMSVAEKLEMFSMLVAMGFKEIEVGFPSASQVEYDFVRMLIGQDLVPPDVTIQVLTQAREQLIDCTIESLRGAKRAVIHMYNSTSELQRRVVFRMDREGIKRIAVDGAKRIAQEAKKLAGAHIVYEYTPESFTGTEMDFSLEVCEAVCEVWAPVSKNRVILNLPATVEMATPNVYADQIEWFCRKISNRKNRVISVHAHNDRGTAVAATELALMAGADRVEGTLFGNGERTGNVDIVTLAMNLFSQGIDPGIRFHDIDGIIDTCERCTRMPVHSRHPYAGELVYTAFSGSHQDAINKGLKARTESRAAHWEVPYLPIDPSDVGRTFEGVIRINSQSGKGGAAYVMEKDFGFSLPKAMHPEFGRMVQAAAEKTGGEISPEKIMEIFDRAYLRNDVPFSLVRCSVTDLSAEMPGAAAIDATITVNGEERTISGRGNGPVDAFSRALRDEAGLDFHVDAFSEHALEKGSDSHAVAYIGVRIGGKGTVFGAGVDTSIDRASLKALLSAVNRVSDLQKNDRNHGVTETGRKKV
ncbi:MAG: 2-isopropylmalate synthase [Nitrospiraceae bacterium]|nr:2-isopropylmalate synthase [Nitrospiraceae bacterium]